jgi:hypothetical protein
MVEDLKGLAVDTNTLFDCMIKWQQEISKDNKFILSFAD